MPKRTAARDITERGEKNLRERIARERSRRGWSYEDLARQMAEAGCPINKAALRSVEKGDPPRRITVDELLALAEIFADGDVEELLMPLQVLEQRAAHGLIERLTTRGRLAAELANESFNGLVELYLMAYQSPELHEYVNHQLDAIDRTAYVEFDVEYMTDDDFERLVEIDGKYWSSIGKLAWARATELIGTDGVARMPARSTEREGEPDRG